jgi:hypothetical protein
MAESKHWLEYAIFGFVVVTAFATSTAAYYSGQQSNTMQDTEIRQLRAYVTNKATRFDLGSVRLDLENSGQTPAERVKILSNWEGRRMGQRNLLCQEFQFPDRDQCPGDKSTAVLSPHEPITTGNLLCNKVKDEAVQAQNRQIDLVLYGHIDYKDIFGKDRSTTFCSFVGPDGAQFCDCHNDIDPQK